MATASWADKGYFGGPSDAYARSIARQAQKMAGDTTYVLHDTILEGLQDTTDGRGGRLTPQRFEELWEGGRQELAIF